MNSRNEISDSVTADRSSWMENFSTREKHHLGSSSVDFQWFLNKLSRTPDGTGDKNPVRIIDQEARKKRVTLLVITIISKNIVTTYCRAIVEQVRLSISAYRQVKIFNTAYKHSSVVTNNNEKQEKEKTKLNDDLCNFVEYYKVSRNISRDLFIYFDIIRWSLN